MKRLLALFVLCLALPAFAGESVRFYGVVEGVNREKETLVVDGYSVHPPKRIRGSIRKFKDIKPGHFAKVFGEIRDDGTLKASYLHVRHKTPGYSFQKKLNSMSLKESKELQKSKDVYTENPAVTEYVRALGQSLVPGYARKRFDFQFNVLHNKEVNAFAYPNGHIYVYTGLLGRVENEAQLASILGHEIAHVTEGHGQRNMRSSMWKYGFFTAGTLLVAAEMDRRDASDLETVIAGVALNLGFMAATNGYGRNQEDQADRVGIRYMVEAGYDPREAPPVWDMFNTVYGDTPTALNIFYGGHSTNKLRKKNQKKELKYHYRNIDATHPGLRVNEAGYQDLMADFLRESAFHDAKEKRYEAAEIEFERYLKIRPDDSEAKEHLEKLHAKKD